jgi:small-conductance mechanosensitive channel
MVGLLATAGAISELSPLRAGLGTGIGVVLVAVGFVLYGTAANRAARH